MSTACDRCLRRGALIGLLAPRIVGRIGRPADRGAALFALSEAELVDAFAGSQRPEIVQMLEGFRPDVAREGLAEVGCDAICRHSSHYPERLTKLHDPPNPIFVRGGVARFAELLAEPSVAVVGGRKPSQYALGVARDLGRGLAAAGVTVVSGLAIGIDGAAHQGALEREGPVIGVLGCGTDVTYPARHEDLCGRVAKHGVLVSELPPGTGVFKWTFPARNRIMAALANVVVVVEAREYSGSLITADFAEQVGVDVGAVPGHVTARMAAGSNRLLRDGAAVIRGPEDVLEMLYGVGYLRRRSQREPDLEPALRQVLDAVELRDSLQSASERAGLSAGGLRAALGRLESLGLVRGDGFGGYERCISHGRAT
jgi:DNA processing protein